MTLAQQRHYQKNKELYKKRAMESKHRSIDSWEQYMIDKKCCRCGIKYSGKRSLDHHHIDPKTKRASVADLLHSHGLKAALDEAQKCEILCPKCHIVEHYGDPT